MLKIPIFLKNTIQFKRSESLLGRAVSTFRETELTTTGHTCELRPNYPTNVNKYRKKDAPLFMSLSHTSPSHMEHCL
jgi:hypothetical protein